MSTRSPLPEDRTGPTPEKLAAFLGHQAAAPRYWVAYSGGLDSTVLLHLVAALAAREPGFCCAAIHIHHGLHPDADLWSAHCAATATQLGLPYQCRRVDARPKPGQSPEEAARDARYAALSQVLQPGEALLTAQHADDQAETLLLQLLRGAGLPGLAAMPAATEFAGGQLLRPLLAYPRDALARYAARHQLRWIDDPSNACVDFDRNFLRRDILPLLRARWPALASTLSRGARHCAEAQTRLDRLADQLLLTVSSPERETLLVGALRDLSESDRRLVMRRWISRTGHRQPSAAVLDQLTRELVDAAPDRNPVVKWGGTEARRYRDELFLLDKLPPPPPAASVLDWNGRDDLILPDGGVLRSARLMGEGLSASALASGTLTVRFRLGGEQLRRSASTPAKTLKAFLQESAIPPWLRARTPLIYLGEDVVAVAGFWAREELLVRGREEGLRFVWRPVGGRNAASQVGSCPESGP